MSTDMKALVGILSVGAAAAAAVVAERAGSPYWPLFLGLPLILVAMSVGRRPADERDTAGSLADQGVPPAEPGRMTGFDFGSGAVFAPPAEPEPVVYEATVTPLPLPSAVAGYDFRFSATVCWSKTEDSSRQIYGSPEAVPVSMIVRRAAELVAGCLPTEAAVAKTELASSLSMPTQDAAGRFTVWARDVALGLSDTDHERLRRMAELRKDEEIWERERAYEKHKRSYLREDVLKSTGSAVVWALARKEDAIERTVDLIGPLAQLSAAANDSEVPPLFRHFVEPEIVAQNGHAEPGPAADTFVAAPRPTVADHVAGIAECLGYTPDAPSRAWLIANLARAFEASGHSDEAMDLRRFFDRFPPTEDEPADLASEQATTFDLDDAPEDDSPQREYEP